MLEAYSLNIATSADSPVPFNNTSLQKGCSVTKAGSSSIELNKKGVYMVTVDGSSPAASTVQLYKNGIAQPQAQSVGTSVGFYTLVQSPYDNTSCCCTAPTLLQVITPTASTFSNINVCVTKVC